MKPKWVATQNAGKFKIVFQCIKNIGVVLLMSSLLLTLSCDKGDDLETSGKKPLLDIVSPPVNETPPANEFPDNESPTEDESNIVYTDIEPDFSSQNLNDFYKLDLNNDQIVDFRLSSGYDTNYEWLSIVTDPNAGNGILSVAPWYTHPVPLDNGKEIYNLRGYRNGEYYETNGFFSIGECFGGEQDCFYSWKNKGDRYLGLRFIINGQIHYGWARIEIESNSLWAVKDYAYNAIPNKPILAGQKK